MKKLSLMLLMLTVCIMASAKKLGDFIEIDGVPAFIFQLDQTGEHGLAMSLPAYNGKDVKDADKLVKKGLLTTEQAEVMKKNSILKFTNKYSNEEKAYFADLVNILTDDGKTNQDKIVAYCNEKGISLADHFPFQHWAASFGDGWFIPGDNELIAFADFFLGGIGRANGLGALAFQKRTKEVSDSELIQNALFRITFYGLVSSSCHVAKSGFRCIRNEHASLPKPKNWLELFDSYVGNPPLLCAVHAF